MDNAGNKVYKFPALSVDPRVDISPMLIFLHYYLFLQKYFYHKFHVIFYSKNCMTATPNVIWIFIHVSDVC